MSGQGRAVYVASPCGFSLPTRIFYNDVLLPALVEQGAQLLDPWAAPFDDLGQALALPAGTAADEAVRAANARHGAYNRELLDRCVAVFAVLDGTDVDSGTAAEVGYAAGRGVPVIGWRSDLRQTGETGAVVNLQVEYFITGNGGSIHRDLAASTAALGSLLRR